MDERLIALGVEKLKKMLWKDRVEKAARCSKMPAHVTLNLKNGRRVEVFDERFWNRDSRIYCHCIKICDELCRELHCRTYDENDKGFLRETVVKCIELGVQ